VRIVLEGLGAEKEEESVTHVLSWGKERTLWEMEVVKVFSASEPGMRELRLDFEPFASGQNCAALSLLT
jgi:hypothetical protein